MERTWHLGSMSRRKEVGVTSVEEDVRGVLCQLSLLGFVHFASFAVAQNWLQCCAVFLSLCCMAVELHQLKLDSSHVPRPGGKPQSRLL